jgi:hypothetical protein
VPLPEAAADRHLGAWTPRSNDGHAPTPGRRHAAAPVPCRSDGLPSQRFASTFELGGKRCGFRRSSASKAAAGYAFLLGWRLDKYGNWHGHVARLVREQVLWKGVDVWMRADDLEQVQGKDYRQVPCRVDDDVPF